MKFTAVQKPKMIVPVTTKEELARKGFLDISNSITFNDSFYLLSNGNFSSKKNSRENEGDVKSSADARYVTEATNWVSCINSFSQVHISRGRERKVRKKPG